MPWAVTLKASNGSDAPIKQLWQQAAAFEAQPSMVLLNHAPHLTFGSYDHDAATPAALEQAIRQTFTDQGPLPIRFERLGYFDSHKLVLWADPVLTPEVRALHAKFHRNAEGLTSRSNYRPHDWTPHCTLATDIAPGQEEAAKAFCQQPITPFTILFDQVDYIEFLPVRICYSQSLKRSAFNVNH